MPLSQKKIKQKLRKLMNQAENAVCVDCQDKRPTWASLIVPPPDAPFSHTIGCFCCYHCSGAHRRMGTHICFVRSTNLDEWKERELAAMKAGGNKLVNSIFEANLTDGAIKPDKLTELEERSEFIYAKYQHRQWYDGSKHPGTHDPVEADFFASRRSTDSDDWWDFESNDSNDELDDSIRKENAVDPFGTTLTERRRRRDILDTLVRHESKANVLDDIAHLDIGDDPLSPDPKPRRLSRSKQHPRKSKGPDPRVLGYNEHDEPDDSQVKSKTGRAKKVTKTKKSRKKKSK